LAAVTSQCCAAACIVDALKNPEEAAEAAERRTVLKEEMAGNDAEAERYRADIAANEANRREIQAKIESAIDANNNVNFLKILSTFRIQVMRQGSLMLPSCMFFLRQSLADNSLVLCPIPAVRFGAAAAIPTPHCRFTQAAVGLRCIADQYPQTDHCMQHSVCHGLSFTCRPLLLDANSLHCLTQAVRLQELKFQMAVRDQIITEQRDVISNLWSILEASGLTREQVGSWLVGGWLVGWGGGQLASWFVCLF
jgi:hypothetical protein